MEELMTMIQQDPELWEIVEKIKDEDVDLQFFLDDVAEMFAIEFRVMDTSDLDDKLDQLFGGLPRKAMVLVLPLLHVALEKYLKSKSGR
jgi:hypothetical protein